MNTYIFGRLSGQVDGRDKIAVGADSYSEARAIALIHPVMRYSPVCWLGELTGVRPECETREQVLALRSMKGV